MMTENPDLMERLERIESAIQLLVREKTIKQAYTFATSLVTHNADGSFTLAPLPTEAQVAPVYGMLARDLDGDGKLDLLLAGNFSGFKPDIGSVTASYGSFLHGDGKGRFTAVTAPVSGFFAGGEARDLEELRTRRGPLYVVTRNNDKPLLVRPTARE